MGGGKGSVEYALEMEDIAPRIPGQNTGIKYSKLYLLS